ncbi:Sorting nexin-18 [Sciurus carolinensis]|uniref:Sorting nexin-18 n=1 Tax=Sciurus carolinensis TaxID=30640 RepID=A0AA41T1T8_SCICA|nr:Sorting nexin-18 [Sciurus carolinensis]
MINNGPMLVAALHNSQGHKQSGTEGVTSGQGESNKENPLGRLGSRRLYGDLPGRQGHAAALPGAMSLEVRELGESSLLEQEVQSLCSKQDIKGWLKGVNNRCDSLFQASYKYVIQAPKLGPAGGGCPGAPACYANMPPGGFQSLLSAPQPSHQHRLLQVAEQSLPAAVAAAAGTAAKHFPAALLRLSVRQVCPAAFTSAVLQWLPCQPG